MIITAELLPFFCHCVSRVSAAQNVSFTVNPGEVVALVGPSGGGKSSCVNLLQHFYSTLSGDVFLDDVPIRQYDHRYLHEKVRHCLGFSSMCRCVRVGCRVTCSDGMSVASNKQ